jgi:3-isopropylmalate/(R)-2-methylmalate dehydratase large subunit
MSGTLYDKVFDAHVVEALDDGLYQLFVGLHFVNDVTSAQAFAGLRERGLNVLFPDRTVSTFDHMVPPDGPVRPYRDPAAEALRAALEANVSGTGITYLAPGSGRAGIVHVIGPELGLSQPGMTICCGDSHTSTHGALGALAFGVGTTQVRDILASQTLATRRLATRQVVLSGRLPPGVEAKDAILSVIAKLGVAGGVGYAYEYTGPVVAAMTLEQRMTLCNMSIEGGARIGYVNPDETTYEFLRGRPFAPTSDWDRAVSYWSSLRTEPDAVFDDVVSLDGSSIEPMVTWGVHPGHSVGVSGLLPEVAELPETERASAEDAYAYTGFLPGQPIRGLRIDVAFIGSCANGRLSDIERVVDLVTATGGTVAPHVRAIVTPGSEAVREQVEALGYGDVLRTAGFAVHRPGCSMCVGMNGAALVGREVCASTSTRNFKGRQGSPTGRTLLMSPTMVAASALAGEVVDVRTVACAT